MSAPADWIADLALALGWTMQEVRRHTLGDIKALERAAKRKTEREKREASRRKARAASKAMGKACRR